MKLPITTKDKVENPLQGFGFAFIDEEDKKLKIRKHDSIIEFSNDLSDVQLLDLTDYSAFEVMPNAEVIPSGTLSNIVYEGETLAYLKEIPACTVHKMTLRSHQEPENCDVVIDWGDGTIEAIRDGAYVSHSTGKSYELSHDYSTTAGKDENGQWKKFIVKIYGKDYYTFRHNSYTSNNLISRIFDVDLPIANHIDNFASICYGAARLLKVHFPHSASPYSTVRNWSSCFNDCNNVISITGFEDLTLRGDATYNAFMVSCDNLKITDFVIPASVSRIETIFANNINLECDINSLLPKNGFTSSNIEISNAFSNLKKMTGTVPADKLWNDKKINWIFLSENLKPFGGCSDEIKAQVPISWGGTASDDIIEKSDKERIAELEARLEALENN